MTFQWYVLRSKPRKETSLSLYAQSQGYEVFYPSIPVKPVNPRASKIQPYFPGYMFVHANLTESGDSAFRWMPLSQGLVHVGGEPAPIGASIITALRRRLEEIQMAGGLQIDGLKRGDPVLVCEGSFEGYEGIFDAELSGSHRVRILLRMVNEHYMPVKMAADWIEKRDHM